LFQEPRPPVPWSGEKDASKPSSMCLQYNGWEKDIAGKLYLEI
jgi:carboxylesterase type B